MEPAGFEPASQVLPVTAIADGSNPATSSRPRQRPSGIASSAMLEPLVVVTLYPPGLTTEPLVVDHLGIVSGIACSPISVSSSTAAWQ